MFGKSNIIDLNNQRNELYSTIKRFIPDNVVMSILDSDHRNRVNICLFPVNNHITEGELIELDSIDYRVTDEVLSREEVLKLHKRIMKTKV